MALSHWLVKGFSSKRKPLNQCIALKIDMLWDGKIYCLQARSCIIQPGYFTDWSSGALRVDEVGSSSINRTVFGVYIDQKILVSAQGVTEHVTKFNVR